MTDLLSRPSRPVPAGDTAPKRPLMASGALATLVAVVVGLVVAVTGTVVAWFAGSTGSFSDAARVGALSWLVANGGGLRLSSVTVTVVPLGGTALLGWFLYRGGRWVGAHARIRGLADVALGSAVIAVVYAACADLCAALVQVGGAHADMVRTSIGALVLAAVAGSLGVARGGGHVAPLLGWLPAELRSVVRGGAAATMALLSVAAALTVASMAAHFSAAVTLTDSMHAGVVGGAALALVGMAVVPNAVLSAGAFVVGPGFSVGTGTTVAPDQVHLGSLPAFPLLAALPESAGQWWLLALMAAPMLAGAFGALVALRPLLTEGRPAEGAMAQHLLRGALAGALGGLMFGALTLLGTGALGPGRMSVMGPHVVPTVVIGTGGMLLGGAVMALLLHVGAPVLRARPAKRRGRGTG